MAGTEIIGGGNIEPRAGDKPFSFIEKSTRRWTGFRPSRTSGSARDTMTDMA